MKDKIELKNFCCNVEKIKQDYNLSDEKLIKMMHTSRKSLKRIKNGEIPERVSVEILFHLNKHFNIDISSLFTHQYKISDK